MWSVLKEATSVEPLFNLKLARKANNSCGYKIIIVFYSSEWDLQCRPASDLSNYWASVRFNFRLAIIQRLLERFTSCQNFRMHWAWISGLGPGINGLFYGKLCHLFGHSHHRIWLSRRNFVGPYQEHSSPVTKLFRQFYFSPIQNCCYLLEWVEFFDFAETFFCGKPLAS